MLTVYGIPNCDTVKKARTWLADQGVDYVFHDFKKQGVPAERLTEWIGAVGLDKLINRKGPTWRKLDAQTQADATDPAKALQVLQAHSSAIKRPVVRWNDGTVSVGFSAQAFAEKLNLAQP
jgi:Spx/MgsR family transcriptional regulator